MSNDVYVTENGRTFDSARDAARTLFKEMSDKTNETAEFVEEIKNENNYDSDTIRELRKLKLGEWRAHVLSKFGDFARAYYAMKNEQ